MMASRRRLRKRWEGQEDRVAAIVADIRKKKDWTRNLLPQPGRWEALPHVHSCRRQQLNVEAAPRDLRGITLRGVDLSGRDGLSDAELDFARLSSVNLKRCSLRGSSLFSAQICEQSNLDRANLEFASCRRARFCDASLRDADFSTSDLRGVWFVHCDLAGTAFRDVTFRWSFAGEILLPWRRTRIISDEQSTRDWSARSDWEFKRFARADLARHSLEQAHPVLAVLDLLLTDYGRSPARLGLWAVLVWLLFAVLFAGVPFPVSSDAYGLQSIFRELEPRFFDLSTQSERGLTFAEGAFFSALALCGFSHSNIVPSHGSTVAQVLVVGEILAGYVLLAVFISLTIQNLWHPDE